MASRTLLAFALTLCSTVSVFVSTSAIAQTPLSQATVQKTRNKVDLIKLEKSQAAKIADILIPGNALKTYDKAMAELRFNDKSLARIGELAIFQFEPNTRNISLKSGTVLLLIPPGQGRTTVRTPSATAGIRGSALFVRYINDSNVTIVGALTNSDIEISSADGTTIVLKAGQVGYVYKDRIGVYNFDQKRFQETSPFFKDLDWTVAPAEVKAEIEAALAAQPPFAGTTENTPAWTMLPENRASQPIANLGIANQPDAKQFATSNTLTQPVSVELTRPVSAVVPVQVPTNPVQPLPVELVPPSPSNPAAPLPPRPVPAPTPPQINTPGTSSTPTATTVVTPPTTTTIPTTVITPPTVAAPPVPTAAIPASPAISNAPAAVTPPPIAPAVPAIAAPSAPVTIAAPAAIATPPAAAVVTPVVQAPAATPTIDRSPVQPAAPAPAPAAPSVPAIPTTTTGTATGGATQSGAATTRPLPITQ